MPDRALRGAGSAPLPKPADQLFTAIMARIQRSARASGVSTEELGVAIAGRLTSWFPLPELAVTSR